MKREEKEKNNVRRQKLATDAQVVKSFGAGEKKKKKRKLQLEFVTVNFDAGIEPKGQEQLLTT